MIETSDGDDLMEIFDRIAKSNRRKLPILQSGAPDDCRECGSCCEYFEIINLEKTDSNFSWLRSNGYLETNEHDHHQLKKLPDGRCMALTGEVGKSVSCSIYDHRPECCRKFKMGSTRCRNIVILDRFQCLEGRKLN